MRASSFLPLIAAVLLALPGCGSGEVIDSLSGTVVDALGAPAPGVHVKVGNSVTTTDASGHFTLSAVTSPYDAAVVTAANPDAFVFLGLTSHSPTLRVYDQYLNEAGDGSGASIAIDLPLDPGSTEQVAFLVDRPDDLSPIQLTLDNGAAPNQWQAGIVWPGSKPTTVRIQALRFQVDKNKAPQHYTGYDVVMLPLTPGDKQSWSASWKAPPFADATISASVDLPSGYQIAETTMSMSQNGTLFGQSFAGTTSTSADMSFVVPGLDDLRFDLVVCAVGTDASSCRIARGLTAGTKGRTITMDEGPSLRSPGAVDDPVAVGSEIQWSANGDGTSAVLLYPKQPGTGPSYLVATTDESFTLPDLAQFGTKLPSGADYNLQIFRNSGAATVDELAEKGPFIAPDGADSTYASSPLLPVKTR